MRGGGGQLTLYIGLSMVAYNRSNSISFGLKALLRGPKQACLLWYYQKACRSRPACSGIYQKARARTAAAERWCFLCNPLPAVCLEHVLFDKQSPRVLCQALKRCQSLASCSDEKICLTNSCREASQNLAGA